MTILQRIKNKIFGAGTKPEQDTRLQKLNAVIDQGLGHQLSCSLQKPVDAAGNPLPWFTYPAIEYLKQLDIQNASILEWGIGNSSRFFSARCKQLISIEHNKEWFDLISGTLPANAKAVYASVEDYATIPFKENCKFDIIIVDGIERDSCIVSAVNLLKEDGFIIFDNAERNPELCGFLRNNNLIEVDFHGYGPINSYTWTTSFFFTRSVKLQPLSHQPTIPAGGGY